MGVDNAEEWYTDDTDVTDEARIFSFVGLNGVAKVQEWYTDETDATDEARIFFFCWVRWG
jgi:uncharacterized protein YneR